MLVTLEEGLLKFQFEEVSVPWKYDDSSFYRNQFQSFAGGTKGVDFLCHTKGTLWLIEVKDYRVYERQKSQDLSEEVEERVRDTLAGLVALRVNGNDLDERKRATAALKKKRLRVVLHLELPKLKRVSKLYSDIKLHRDFQEHLKAVVRAVDSHPKVVCMAEGLQYCPWTVTE